MDPIKRNIRQALRAQRACLRREVAERAGVAVLERICQWDTYAGAEAVLAYFAADNELPLGPLIEAAWRSGKAVYLPRIEPAGFFRYVPGDALCIGPWGIPEPAGGVRFRASARAVIFIPVVGWDLDGNRLGRGRGWYDRVLPLLGSGVARVGVGYEFQRCERLPRRPGDVALDFVVTEKRLLRCEGSPNGGLGRRENEP